MEELYGSDFISITDEDGNEYELEVLSTLEYRGKTYLAVIPAQQTGEAADLQVSILLSSEEDGETILSTVDDDETLETVYTLIMEQLYQDEP